VFSGILKHYFPEFTIISEKFVKHAGNITKETLFQKHITTLTIIILAKTSVFFLRNYNLLKTSLITLLRIVKLVRNIYKRVPKHV